MNSKENRNDQTQNYKMQIQLLNELFSPQRNLLSETSIIKWSHLIALVSGTLILLPEMMTIDRNVTTDYLVSPSKYYQLNDDLPPP